MYFSLKIFSKNKNSLIKFLNFLYKLKSPFITFLNFPQRKKKNFFTVLKSPHINKTAQEQFEYKIFSKKIYIWSPQYKFLLILLKKTVKTSFPGIQFQLHSLVSLNIEKNKLSRSLNPKNVNIFFFQKVFLQKKLLKKNLVQHINLFDSFGELIVSSGIVY